MAQSAATMEHTAKVHFALIATCFALALATRLNESSTASRAREQLRHVRTIGESFRSGWTSEYFAENRYLTQTAPQGRLLRISWKPPDAPGPVYAIDPTGLYKERADWMAVWGPLTEYSPPLTNAVSELSNPSFRLKTFQTVWDTLRTYRGIYRIKSIENVIVYPKASSITCKEAQQFTALKVSFASTPGEFHTPDDEASVHSIETEPECRSVTNGTASQFLFVHAVYAKNGHGDYRAARLDVDTESIPLNSPLTLMLRRAGLSESPLPFAETFPDLTALTATFAQTPVNQIDDILKAFQEQTPGDLELLGVKMPHGAITGWGGTLLVFLQIYLLVNVHQLVFLGNTYPHVEITWFALYPGIGARSAALFSLTVLPVGTIALLIFRQPGGIWGFDRLSAFLLPLLGVICSIFQVLLMLRLWSAYRRDANVSLSEPAD